VQPGTAIEEIYKMNSFPEPRLVVFAREQDIKEAQEFIITEKQILFEVDNFTLVDRLVSLIAAYYTFYVSYPKSSPATGVLLFIEELLLEQPDVTVKKTKYVALIDAIISDS
jgi:hypothetical protein